MGELCAPVLYWCSECTEHMRSTYTMHLPIKVGCSIEHVHMYSVHRHTCTEYNILYFVPPPNTPPSAGVRSCIWLQAVPANKAASPGMIIVILAGAMLHSTPLLPGLDHLYWPVRPDSAVHPGRWIAMCGTVVWRVGPWRMFSVFFFFFFPLLYVLPGGCSCCSVYCYISLEIREY